MFFYFILDLNTKEDDIKSDLPVSTVLAIKNIVPNIPNMIVDFTDIIMADETDVSNNDLGEDFNMF